jgi:uncharacterized protein YidB (DUF937 family)
MAVEGAALPKRLTYFEFAQRLSQHLPQLVGPLTRNGGAAAVLVNALGR